MRLNIAIPTYNRNSILRASLARLLPQITNECRVFILDNCSTIPVRTTLEPLLACYPDLTVDIVRNPHNVGAHANILRCFEYADAEWLWVLGDDDEIKSDAVEIILHELSKLDDAVFLGFRTFGMKALGLRPVSYTVSGLEEFAEKIDDPGTINFMSCSIWRVPRMTPFLHLAYHYAYSMSHTFILLLASLGENGLCHFSSEIIIDQATTADLASRWNYTDFMLGFNTVLELPMSRKARADLAHKMFRWTPPENIVVYFLANAVKKHCGGFPYHVASSRIMVYQTSPWIRFRMRLYRIFFLCPSLSWKVVRAAVQFAVKIGIKNVSIEEIEAR